jgi:GxxExxY protein
LSQIFQIFSVASLFQVGKLWGAGPGGAAMIHGPLTEKIISCAIEVHNHLGPGLLESIYKSALSIELGQRGVRHECEKRLQVGYKGESIGEYKIDLLVEDTVVVELKSVERFDPVFEAQLLSYMKLGNYHIGLLINFNTLLLSKGIKRMVA